MLKKFQAAAAELGTLNAFLFAADKLLQAIRLPARIFRYILVAQPVPERPLTPPGRGTTIVIRELHRDEESLRTLPPPAVVIAARFDQGAVCLGAFKKDELIGCIWLQLGPYQEDEVRCRFVPLPQQSASWDFDVYLEPAHRLGFAFPRMWDGAYDYLRERDIHWSISRISAFNAASLASHTRLEARRLGYATYIRLGGWELMLSDLSPRVHLSTGPRSIPELSLRVSNEPG